MAFIVQKLCGDFFLSEFVSGYFNTKKNPFSTKLERGGGYGLSDRATKRNDFFCGFPKDGQADIEAYRNIKQLFRKLYG